MKRFALAIVGITFAAPVLAEPAQQQTAIPSEENGPSHVDWTGPYIGLQTGAALGGHSATASQDVIPRFDDKSAASFIGGVHIGYDFQLANNTLIGGIADISYVDYDRSAGYNAPGLGEVYRSSFRQNFLGTI